ncbi:MAG: hypothetical protein Q8O90_06750, partial [Elusimicrobiota bacterium]|nr:hypothetical protein [Elusimicrobiota bacterium]
MKTIRFSFLNLLFWTLMSPNTFAAPNLPDPGWENGTPGAFTPLTCDYGPRNSVGTNPHIGIDYDIRAGEKAYAVEGGAVSLADLGSDLAKISIGDWRYIHMATNTAIFQVYRKDDSNPFDLAHPIEADVIVFREVAGNSTTTKKAISAKKFSNDFYDPLTGTPVLISTMVSAGDWVFVSRAYSTPKHTDLANHLHLDYKRGLENPFRYVLHEDVNNPVAVLHPKIKQIGGNGLASDFTSDILYSTGAPLMLQAG